MRLPEAIIKDIPMNVVSKIECFIDLCREISIIISTENENFLHNQTFTVDEQFHLKNTLVKRFEEDAKTIFPLVEKHAPRNTWLRLYLISEVNVLRKLFKINTSLLVNDLQNRSKRIESIKGKIYAASTQEDNEAVTCH